VHTATTICKILNYKKEYHGPIDEGWYTRLVKMLKWESALQLTLSQRVLQIHEQESSDIHGGDELLSIFIQLMRIT